MKGWLATKGKIYTCSLEQSVLFFKKEGFEVIDQGDNHVEFERKGTEFTLKGSKLPLHLLAIKESEYIKLYLRYATFALCDSGDLEKLMKEYIDKLN